MTHVEIGVYFNELIDIRNTRNLEHLILRLVEKECIDIQVRMKWVHIDIEPGNSFSQKAFRKLLEDLQLESMITQELRFYQLMREIED